MNITFGIFLSVAVKPSCHHCFFPSLIPCLLSVVNSLYKCFIIFLHWFLLTSSLIPNFCIQKELVEHNPWFLSLTSFQVQMASLFLSFFDTMAFICSFSKYKCFILFLHWFLLACSLIPNCVFCRSPENITLGILHSNLVRSFLSLPIESSFMNNFVYNCQSFSALFCLLYNYRYLLRYAAFASMLVFVTCFTFIDTENNILEIPIGS